jgi:hypothetical protein
MFLGLMAYLKPKGGWDKSMPLKPWSGEGIEQRHGEIRVTWQNCAARALCCIPDTVGRNSEECS